MSDFTWHTEHSVETVASPDYAWAYMTDLTHWDDPPAKFQLARPFAAGSHVTTEIPGQPARHWQLCNVQPLKSYTIDFALDRAVLSFTWRFRRLPDNRTRLTQEITLKGESAAAHVDELQRAFSSSLPAGMSKVARRIGHAFTAGQHNENDQPL